jgi:hypothetical protein
MIGFLFHLMRGSPTLWIFLHLLVSNCCAQVLPATQIYQFPASPFTSIENIHIRSNGDLLLNVVTSAETYVLDPKQENPHLKFLHSYPGANSTLGIVETAPDIFAVAVGNYSIDTYIGIKGSFAIWKIDLSSGLPGTATKVTSIPEAESFNGATIITGRENEILVADSQLGGLWAVNIDTGHYKMAFQSKELLPTTSFPLGVNGIQTRGSRLYFTNSAQRTYGSVRLTVHGTIEGPVEIIANNSALGYYDDFTFDSHGNAYVTNHPNMVTKISPFGSQSLLAGNDSAIVQPTSVAFGRGSPAQECILYVVTAGDSTLAQSGQVVAIDACRQR